MEEFTFSKQYASMFAEAKKIKNIDLMEQIFNELMAEVGAPNEAVNLSGAESGKRLAELLNSKGLGGKKV